MRYFDEVLNKNLKKEELFLGYNEQEDLIVSVQQYPSIIITGETGSGKSILLDQILLQMIHKMTSLELGIIPIDTSGVELNYYAESKYTLISAINDKDKAQVALARVLKEISRRKELLRENQLFSVDEYNEYHDVKLPFLIVAIDDDKFLLRDEDMEKILSGIISQVRGLNLLFVLATSDVHNEFFEKDRNAFASLLISFDYTNNIEASNANIDGANNLAIGEFLARKDGQIIRYNNFEFDDATIKEIINE